MKKILIILLALLSLTACQEYGKKEADPKERYIYLIEMLEEHQNFADSSSYFDIGVEMARIDDGYRYYIIIDEPKLAMYDVEVLAIEKGVDYLDNMAANVGIFEDMQYNLVPNQTNAKRGFVKGVVASGVTGKAETKLYVFVQFKNSDYSSVHTEYFEFTARYEE